jgi:hypothetical protein
MKPLPFGRPAPRLFGRAGPVRYAVATGGNASWRLGRPLPPPARPPE